MCYGEKIREYLASNGIKQYYLAEKIDVSENIMSYMLTGKRKITVGEYAKICEVLKLPYDYFMVTE